MTAAEVNAAWVRAKAKAWLDKFEAQRLAPGDITVPRALLGRLLTYLDDVPVPRDEYGAVLATEANTHDALQLELAKALGEE